MLRVADPQTTIWDELLPEEAKRLPAELAQIVSAAIETNHATTDRIQTTLTEAQAQALAARSALGLLDGHDKPRRTPLDGLSPLPR